MLRYDAATPTAIDGLRRVSRPGQRVYVRHGTDPQRPLAAWASRSCRRRKGVMTDRAARKQGVGGELLCEVW